MVSKIRQKINFFQTAQKSRYMHRCYLQTSILGVRVSSGEPRPFNQSIFKLVFLNSFFNLLHYVFDSTTK